MTVTSEAGLRRGAPILDRIPASKRDRNRLVAFVTEYVAVEKPVPPLSLDELFNHTAAIIERNGLNPVYRDYLTVLVGNEVWREQVAGRPYDRRLLLLPKCLRSEKTCPADFDDLGLVCERCGACAIGDLGEEAEKLGYVVLVAEGSPVVMALIETGQVDAIIGVSCLSVLERVFPYMETGAVPGVAIPLLNEGCCETSVDLDWVWDAIHMTSVDTTRQLDLDALRSRVDDWFTREALEKVLGPAESSTEKIARKWLAKAGKRWRPYLAACVFQTFQKDPNGPLPADVQAAAIAVECFHKASLIHDDIEDDDDVRYGEKTLHEEHGVPIALNVGDFLLGEGYRLLAATTAAPEHRAALLRVAAEGHRVLCIGQGTELSWTRKPGPLGPGPVLEIFRRKTAPAFEVALRIGAILAGQEPALRDVLKKFSAAVGTAYQIRDDIEDFGKRSEASDLLAVRPSLLLALAQERAMGSGKDLLESVWCRAAVTPAEVGRLERLIRELDVESRAQKLLDDYKNEAIRCLCGLENTRLKGFLRRVVGRIFNDVEFMGCCNDHLNQGENAEGREGGTEAA